MVWFGNSQLGTAHGMGEFTEEDRRKLRATSGAAKVSATVVLGVVGCFIGVWLAELW